MSPAAFSARRNPQRTPEGTPPVSARLRPCRTTFLIILSLRLLELLPYGIRVQLRCRLAALDMLVEDRRHVRFRDFGVPRRIRIDDDGWSLLAGAEAGRTADEDFARRHTFLHEAHVKGHEEGG